MPVVLTGSPGLPNLGMFLLRVYRKENSVDDLARHLANAAMEASVMGALEYIRAHGHKLDSKALSEVLERHCKAAIPGALDDAREAEQAGMNGLISATFLASMKLAGINAAKELYET